MNSLFLPRQIVQIQELSSAQALLRPLTLWSAHGEYGNPMFLKIRIARSPNLIDRSFSAKTLHAPVVRGVCATRRVSGQRMPQFLCISREFAAQQKLRKEHGGTPMSKRKESISLCAQGQTRAAVAQIAGIWLCIYTEKNQDYTIFILVSINMLCRACWLIPFLAA